MKKSVKMKILTSVIGLVTLLPLQTQAAPDLTHGGVLAINSGKAAFTSTTSSAFNVINVVSNTLLLKNPLDSNITIPASGNYIATTTVNTCIGGATGYINASVLLKGVIVAETQGSTNSSEECGSAVATTSIYAKKGDVISGQCRINNGSASTCSFSLALSGLPY